MIDRLTLLVTDWMKGLIVPEYGVNALLSAVPREAGDEVPPALVAITDDVRDEQIALGGEPYDVPAIVVLVDSAAAASPLGGERAPVDIRQLVVATIYVGRSNAGALGRRQAGYALHACRMSLAYLAAADAAKRRRNKLELVRVKDVTEMRLGASIGQASLVGANLATCHCRELAPF